MPIRVRNMLPDSIMAGARSKRSKLMKTYYSFPF
jgi:hypothetical protein